MAAVSEDNVECEVGAEPLRRVAVPGSVASENTVQGEVRSVGDGKIVLKAAGTSYELDLRFEGDSGVAAGTVVRGTVHVKGRKVWTVSAGGRFVTPICGEPRVIQGWVKNAEPGRLVVEAGLSVIVELPQEPSAYDMVNGPVVVGALVNITLFPGAAYRLMR